MPKLIVLEHLDRSFGYRSEAKIKELSPYISQIGEVKDFTKSACFVKFSDGKSCWIENYLLRNADLKDHIKKAIELA